MSEAAIATMAVAMIVIWGGLIASITHAVRSTRRRRRDPRR